MEVKCYRTETYHVHALIEPGRIEGKGVLVRVLPPTFFQRDGIGRRVRLRSGCLYGVEGSSPSAGISYNRILQRRMTIRLHASFVFVVLGEDSGIFRDTRVLRQGMLKEQELS